MFLNNMFGVQQIKDVAEGWTNYALGKEKELSESRMKICRECPLYNKENDRCDSKRCWDTKANKLTDMPGKDVICGCSCYMTRKTSLPRAKCVLGKW